MVAEASPTAKPPEESEGFTEQPHQPAPVHPGTILVSLVTSPRSYGGALNFLFFWEL
jgi:hypothetical protein